MPGRKKPPLLQYLGIPEDEMLLSPYISELPIEQDACYLISSDGLTDMVSEDDIAAIIKNSATIQEGAHNLLTQAMEAGGKDNTTIILVRVMDVTKELKDRWPFSVFMK